MKRTLASLQKDPIGNGPFDNNFYRGNKKKMWELGMLKLVVDIY